MFREISNNKRRNPGFTFIELIIAVTIFSIIAVSIYSTFNAGIKVWLKTSPMIEANQSLRVFFNTISLDLKNAVAYYGKEQTLIKPGFGQSYEGNINFEGKPDRISFITIVGVSGPDTSMHEEIVRVTYIYDKINKTVKRLVATRTEGLNEENAKSLDMLSKVEEKDFGFEFCYKNALSNSDYEYDWRNEWTDKNVLNIPRAVRVKAGGSRKTIFIPSGELGEEI
ncbi:MAG: prepilin-type N-terminal cleavage/methylation domain-containing protein [Candidatus Omnitrophota bacterium]